jgi:hypothetical protein
MNSANLVRRNRKVPVSFCVMVVRDGRVLMFVRPVLVMISFVILDVDVRFVIAGMRVPYRDAAARSAARVQKQQVRRTRSTKYSGPLALCFADYFHRNAKTLSAVK